MNNKQNNAAAINTICKVPFLSLQINNEGDVYTCCPAYVNYNKIGNILENTLEDIWYSKNAKELRKRVLNNDYSMCNRQLCRSKLPEYIQDKLENTDFYSETPPLPICITLAYDRECNLNCITCRDEKYKNSKELTEIYNKKTDEILLPLMKNAQHIALSGSGEAFFSAHSRFLIKKLTHANSKIKFDINTNGLLFNENNVKALNLEGKINEIFVSLPALTEKTYNAIMKGSNLDIVKNNIKYMAQLQKTGKIFRCTINTVISDLNYKEIPDLISFAKELDIFITLSQFYHWGTQFGKDYPHLAVWKKNHINHSDFVVKLKQINYDKCYMQPLFKELLNTERDQIEIL